MYNISSYCATFTLKRNLLLFILRVGLKSPRVNNFFVVIWVIFYQICQIRSSRPGVFCKKGVLGNFAKFIGKHKCLRRFFNKVAGTGVFLRILWNFKGHLFIEHLRATASDICQSQKKILIQSSWDEVLQIDATSYFSIRRFI